MASEYFVFLEKDIGPQQIAAVVRHPDSSYWYLYLNPNRQLAFRLASSPDGEWSEEEILPVGGAGDWVVAVDGGGDLHGVGFEAEGPRHWCGRPGYWEEQALTHFVDKHDKIFPLFLGHRQDALHLVYLTHGPLSGDWSLNYTEWSNLTWGEPLILASAEDTGWECQPEYWSADMDSQGLLHLVYAQPDFDRWKLYHRSLVPGSTSGKAFLLCASAPPGILPGMVIDLQDDVHLLWVDAESGELKYRQRQKGGWPRGGWLKEHVITPWAQDYLNPVLLIQGETVAAAWQQAGRVCGCISKDAGKSWEPTSALAGLKDTWLARYVSGRQPGEMVAHWSFCTNSPPSNLVTPTLFLVPVLLQQEVSEATSPPEQPAAVEKHCQEPGQDLSFFIQQHNDYFQRLIQQVEDLKYTNTQLELALQEKIRELNAAANLSRQAEARARSLSQQMLTQHDTIKLMESNLQRATGERGSLMTENQKLTQQLEALKEEIKSHLTAQREKETELVNQKRVVREKENELAAARQALREKEAEAVTLARYLQEKEHSLAALDRQLRDVQELYRQAQQKLAERKPGLLERLSKAIQ
ncbi:hypothetical protein SY88_04365 [Clostridiales bacterium PH28_bin88]|nr:hypothetical protein SY88_04365 [Clostridiales bacterium PH28_bin88]